MNGRKSSGGKAILLVSEDESVRNGLIRVLVHRPYTDYHVSSHTSGAAALEAARNLDTAEMPVAVCVAACSLPDMAGAELLHALHRLSPRVSSALISTRRESHVTVQAIKDELADRWIDASAGMKEMAHHVAALSAHSRRLEELYERLSGHPAHHLFVTGATGFLGTRFIRDVLRCTEMKVTALTRSRKAVPYDQRLPYSADDFPGRLRFVEGDVRLSGLGISEEDRESLKESVDEVWHLAALTTFDDVLRDATFAVNLGGTQNVLEFAHGLPKLTFLNHVSTAYVCGDTEYPDAVPERLLDRPKAFRNPYEESKFEAERLVADSGLPHLMYRPSIILGETVSGRSDGQTVYNIAKMVRLAKLLGDKDCRDRCLPAHYHSFRVVANTESRKNLVPVDDVTSMMLRIRATDPVSGTIFNLTNPKSIAIGDIVETIAELLQTNNYEIVDSLEGEALSVPEQALERVAQIFRPYMVASDPAFDLVNSRKALGLIRIPEIDKSHLRFVLDAFYCQFFGMDYNEVPIEARSKLELDETRNGR